MIAFPIFLTPLHSLARSAKAKSCLLDWFCWPQLADGGRRYNARTVPVYLARSLSLHRLHTLFLPPFKTAPPTERTAAAAATTITGYSVGRRDGGVAVAAVPPSHRILLPWPVTPPPPTQGPLLHNTRHERRRTSGAGEEEDARERERGPSDYVCTRHGRSAGRHGRQGRGEERSPVPLWSQCGGLSHGAPPLLALHSERARSAGEVGAGGCRHVTAARRLLASPSPPNTSRRAARARRNRKGVARRPLS